MHLRGVRLNSSCYSTKPRRVVVRTRAQPVSAPQVVAAGNTIFHYKQIELTTQPGIALFDITPSIRAEIESLGLQEGFVNVISRHTTTAVTINENETRLMDDVRQVGPLHFANAC